MAIDSGRVAALFEEMILSEPEDSQNDQPEEAQPQEDLDPRLAWFLTWFKEKPTVADSLNTVLSWRMGGGKTCFLGDADSLILKPAFFTETLGEIKRCFPTLNRFTVYGRTRTAARVRTLRDLVAFQKAGLDRIHFGVESGSDTVLRLMKKGVFREEHIEAGQKSKTAGLSCSVYVMPGLGGMKWSEEHAHDTADVLTRMAPDYVRIRSLQIFPQTPLDRAQNEGDFIPATEEQVVKEIRTLVDGIDSETEIVSDSASNLLNVNGRLPKDRTVMLTVIDQYLGLTRREKLEFSLKSRLQSFIGQYGALTSDILNELRPYVTGSSLNLSRFPDSEMKNTIRLIRSKLMP